MTYPFVFIGALLFVTIGMVFVYRFNFDRRGWFMEVLGILMLIVGLPTLYASMVPEDMHAQLRSLIKAPRDPHVATRPIGAVLTDDELEWDASPPGALWVAITVYDKDDAVTYVLPAEETKFPRKGLTESKKITMWYGTPAGPSTTEVVKDDTKKKS